MPSTIHNDNGHTGGSKRARAGRLPVRPPLPVRKRAQRRAGRVLIARRTRRAPTPAQMAFDPLARPSHRSRRRRAFLGLAVVGSLAFHAATVALGLRLHQGQKAPRREEVAIEMRQRPPEPPPELSPSPAAPEKPAAPPPKIAKAPPAAKVPRAAKLPPPPTPPAPAKAAPLRVVGLSLESTGDAGDGPSFAVGNTRLGETEKTAHAPREALPEPPSSSIAAGPGRSNQVASRIPVGGIKYERPKPRKTPEPDYPADLKSQGIEADVMVLASIDVAGKVTAVKVIKAAPYEAFNAAARAAVMTYEYEPATRDGVPTTYQLSFTVRFRVKDNE